MTKDHPSPTFTLISPEAEAFAAQAPNRDLSQPLDDLRAMLRKESEQGCMSVVEKTGITLSEQTIAGVPCMVITPPEPRMGRKLVYLFGGGFTLGSPFEDLPISASLAAKTGAVVIAPHYPLAPEHPHPAALDACTAVISSVLAETPGACLCGESAGGNLALAALHQLRETHGPQPKALALLSPFVDVINPGDSGRADRDPFLNQSEIEFFRSCYMPQNADPTHPDISPIYGSFDADFPPVFLTSGTRDHLLSGCVRLDHLLREAGADCTLRIWEGMWHVFEFYPEIPEADASLTEIAGFLNRHFAGA
ncbi:alpha/beta hydrolase [Ruegeria arenilitoris]|uniref:alpha/beta hydrolase n=1 Tax=Ruegeria arenilitoris TaxID=1173585 RepID=UPI00147EE882|nr:alpha/beta hydrolase [Ruegeria arenilitoris]